VASPGIEPRSPYTVSRKDDFGAPSRIMGFQGGYFSQLMALTLCVFGRDMSESTVPVVS